MYECKEYKTLVGGAAGSIERKSMFVFSGNCTPSAGGTFLIPERQTPAACLPLFPSGVVLMDRGGGGAAVSGLLCDRGRPILNRPSTINPSSRLQVIVLPPKRLQGGWGG